MITIENASERRRSWRHNGVTLWIEPGQTIEVDAILPPRARVKAFASSGLLIRAPQAAAQAAARPEPVGSGLPAPHDGSTAPAGGLAQPSNLTIPDTWREMPWQLMRGWASRVAGRSVRTRAEAEEILAAVEARR